MGDKYEISYSSVTQRELEGTDILQKISQYEKRMETFVWGESVWGSFVWGGQKAESFAIGESPIGVGCMPKNAFSLLYEKVLQIISDRSFPERSKRDNLSKGQRNQLRDAMNLLTHIQHNGDWFITQDYKGFGKDGSEKRKKLEKLTNTRILSKKQFLDAIAQ